MSRLFETLRTPVAAIIMTIAFALAGCSSTPSTNETSSQELPPAGAVAMIIGAHANTPAPSTSDAINAAIRAADNGLGGVTLIVDDGAPHVVETFDAPDCGNGDACTKRLADRRLLLENAIVSARAKTPEVDLLGAITLAARTLSSTEDTRLLVISDSALSTTGTMAFQAPGLLMAEPADIAQYLVGYQVLPKLSGVDVVLTLCNTAPPQEPLTPAACDNLTNIWIEILRTSGAKSVTVMPAALSGDAIADAPHVTAVPMPTPPPPPPPSPSASSTPTSTATNTATSTETPAPPSGPGEITQLTNDQLRFTPGDDTYLHPAEAERALRPIAHYIRENHLKVRIVGTTSSWGTKQGRKQTSTDRANTVRDSLIEYGVPASDITADGAGMNFPGYVADRDPNTNILLPIKAAENRKTIIESLPG